MRRVLLSCLVGVLVTACSDGGESRGSKAKANEVVPTEGRVLAAVKGVGAILEGFAVFDGDDPEVRASHAGPAQHVDGVLAAGPGLAGEVDTPFTGALQVRLNVPEPPSDDAIPVAIHRAGDGRVSIEPALWDPGASQMVVWATSFSDRWGAWFDPRNWIEEVVQAGQGAFDFAADFVTGRTDPPACRNDPPGWASMSVNEVSSLHVCAQSNPADDGAERFELFLKSNRRTAQLVTIPSVAKDYSWTENVPDEWRRLLTSFTGVDANTNVVVLGTYAMSVGFRQPEQSVDFEMRAYQTPRIIVANPVFALLGNLPLEGTLGAMAAVAKCHAEASGIDVTRFDAIPDSNPPDVGFLEGMVRCAFETLQHPELAFGVVQEVAGAISMSKAGVLKDIDGALRSLKPTVERIAKGVAIGSTLTNLWDGIFDNLADGRITATLAGSVSPQSGVGDLVGCKDPKEDALRIGAYLGQAFSRYGTWTDAPNFGDVAHPVMSLLAACGRDHAYSTLESLNVVGTTWRALTTWVDEQAPGSPEVKSRPPPGGPFHADWTAAVNAWIKQARGKGPFPPCKSVPEGSDDTCLVLWREHQPHNDPWRDGPGSVTASLCAYSECDFGDFRLELAAGGKARVVAHRERDQ